MSKQTLVSRYLSWPKHLKKYLGTVNLFCFALMIKHRSTLKGGVLLSNKRNLSKSSKYFSWMELVRCCGPVLNALVPDLKSAQTLSELRKLKAALQRCCSPVLNALVPGFRSVAVIALTVTLAMGGMLTNRTHAAAGINQQLNFQARLLNSSGGLVPDGNYNVQFNIYSGGDGDPGTADETLEWTGTHLNGNTDGVRVVNGYLTVQLGSSSSQVNTLADVDWNDDTLWLSINIGDTGSATTCSTEALFNSNCGGDGEMDPFMRLTSVPYAFNANQLDGLDSTNFVQLAQGEQAVNTASTLIAIDNAGAGDLIDLQVSNATRFSVNNAGNGLFGGDLAINGGDITSTQTTFNLLNSTVTTANLLGAATTINIGATTGTTTINNLLSVAGASTGVALTVDNSTSTGAIAIFEDNGTAVFTVSDGGAAVFAAVSDSAALFDVQDAADQSYLRVDTVNLAVEIGGGTDDVLLVVDTFSADPAGAVNGAIWYDTDTNKFRCGVNGSWVDCDTTGSGGNTITLQLSPEFAGGTLSADGSNNNVRITADFVSGLSGAEGEKHIYYEVDTNQSSAQDYDVVVQVPIPSDFSSMGAASTFKFWHRDPDAATTNANTTWELYDVDETQCFSSTFEGSTSNVWEQESASSLGSCSFAADDIITFVFKLKTTSGAGPIWLGEFEFQYSN